MAVTFAVLRRVIMSGAKQHGKQASLGSSPKKPPTSRQATRSQTRNQSSTSPDKKPQTSVKKSYSDSGLNNAFGKLSISQTSSSPTRSSSSLADYSKKGSAKNVRSISTFSVSSLEDIAELIKQDKCRRIVIMAGAGISTPSGIPDFRSPGSGLYDNLQKYNVPEPTDIFDINYFWYDPKPFFCLAQTLYPGNFQPNYVHYFIRLLFDRGLLHRVYTQNIDGLERLAGIPPVKLIEAHGTFATASCVSCREHHNGAEIKETILKGDIPKCKIEGCSGVVKPDIVFFGENLPKRFYSFTQDIPHCDLLIVMGTSLEVEPFAGIAREVHRATPRILFNREVVGPFKTKRKRSNDIVSKGEIVKSVKQFVEMLGWTEELDKLISEETQKWRETYGTCNVELTNSENESKDSGTETVNGNKTDHVSEKVTAPTNKRTLHTQSVSNSEHENYTVADHSAKAESLSCANSVVRTKMPTFTLRGNAAFVPVKKETKPTLTRSDFKAIDPMQDLASAGFGLGKRTELNTRSASSARRRQRNISGAKFLTGETDSSEDSSESDNSSVKTRAA